ncbi:MAG: hypothetical protein FJ387_29205 [Verrucomicrobia bacterium]|nr:hypothetical protein [Verrucomicrobiota bacterium]
MPWYALTWTLALGWLATLAQAALPSFDFTRAADRQGWTATHDVGPLSGTAEGMTVTITGPDPYITGPARDYPAGTPLWLRLRLRSEAGGMCQVFYFRGGATEENSVRFYVPRGEWHEAKVRMPALGPSYRLRVDPPGTAGACLLGQLSFEERMSYVSPAWPTPVAPRLGSDAVWLESGPVRLVHGGGGWGAFEVRVGEDRLACGNTAPLVGYVAGGQPRWWAPHQDPGVRVTVERQAEAGGGAAIRSVTEGRDTDGAQWRIEQWFRAGDAGAVAVTTQVEVDRDREVLYLPVLTLMAGLGSYGTNKTQALLAGVEYLENEPSSSRADLNPPASDRQVPDLLKVTFPLMAVNAGGAYVGLAWDRHEHAELCAVFDSPDRLFQSEAHLLGLLIPGSDGLQREESSLVPYGTWRLAAGQALTVRAQILGGRGSSVVPAVAHYVRLYGLPAVPEAEVGRGSYAALAAGGWLDSQIREGDRYRHAAPGFGAGPAADAALYMDWLAQEVSDEALAGRLTAAAGRALAQVPIPQYNAAQVGHVRYPVPALVYGGVQENLARAREQGRGLLGRFQPDGTVLYQKPSSGLDYGKTHWAPHANGLTAQVLAGLLEAAVFAGDPSLQTEGLRLLRALTRLYGDTVPRGAQTWEIPLHTPDILAAAHLVKAYTIGYELTGAPEFLAQAQYWAWTGLPFVYLTPPTAQPIGVYSTIAVLGATAWVAPVWIGLPVQWCGLVYADALRRLAPYDAAGPWRRVADGIAVAGVQHTYPVGDTEYMGLLPDSYNLRAQSRNGPAINPATVLAPAIPALGAAPVYTFRAFNRHGLLLHAPGAVEQVDEGAATLRLTVAGWSRRPYWILMSGFTQVPAVRLNGLRQSLSAPHEFQPTEGRLILRAEGRVTIELEYPAQAAVGIEPGPGSDEVRVGWPSLARAYALESATELSPSAAWFEVATRPDWVGARLVVREAVEGPQRFYRLRRRFEWGGWAYDAGL